MRVTRTSLLCCAVATLSAVESAVASPPAASPYRLTRYSENWSFLKDESKSHSIFDPIKYIPLGGDGAYLSLGGEARLTYEFYDNSLFGQGPQDSDGYLMQRYHLHADLHLNPSVRGFVDFKSSLSDGRVGGPRPIDEDRLDLNQAFVDLTAPIGDDVSITLRTGRQELLYGSARLITNRAGSPNTRFAFDGLKLVTRVSDWQVDTFYARPVETDPGEWDNSTDDTQSLWSVYATGKIAGLPGSVDLYYIGFRDDDASYVGGRGDETRHTLGTRLFGRQAGFDWNWEFMYQFGEFSDDDIRAWSIGTETGYTFSAAPLKPRLSLRANVISGDDDPDDGTLGAFNALYPRGGYFGEIGVVGPRSIINLHPALDLQLRDDLTLTVDTAFYWRYAEEDGLYNNAGVLIRPPGNADARYIGTQPSATLRYRATEQLTVTAICSAFLPGSFIEETGTDETIVYFRLELSVRF